jgi:hypothetical protein
MAARTKSVTSLAAEPREGELPVQTVRVPGLPALLTPIDEDVLHVVDMSAAPEGVDKKLALGTIIALVRQGTASAAQGDLADTALQPGSVNLGYTATTRVITNTGGNGVTLPLVSVTLAGLAPASGGGTANFLRADGTWAIPPGAGSGTVLQVDGGAGLTGSVTTTGALAVGAGVGITVGVDSVSIDRTVTDGWYASAAQGSLAASALQPGSVDLGYIDASRTITNTAGDPVVLPLVTSGAAGLAPQSGGGTTNFLRADGTWAAPAGGSGTVTNVTGTAPIAVTTGTSTPVVSITPASGSAPGSMSAADFTKLAGVATGATANSTDAQLRDRSTHTGTQTVATISDFTASSRATVEATLVAGTNITLTPSGSGATRSITIASTASGGGGGTVTQVDGGAGLTGSVTTTGSLAVGAGTGINVTADAVAVDRTVVDTWYASAAQGTLAASALQPGQAATTAQGAKADTALQPGQAATTAQGAKADTALQPGQAATTAQGALADTALQPGSVDLGYTAASRTITNTGGDPVVLPLFSTTAGLVPGTASSTTQFLRADGTWVVPPIGTGTVTGVTGTAPIVSSGGAAPAISINPASGSAPGSMSSADFTKLASNANGATPNSSDAQLRNRSTHTGTQLAATISDFNAAAAAAAPAANLSLANNTATTLDVLSSTGTDVTLPAATGTLAGLFTSAGFTKLSGIATGATANDTDANLKNRANHTGTQAGSTVTGLYTASGMTMATARMLGRTSASTGAVEEITIGAGLLLSAGTLIATGGGGGGDPANAYLTVIFHAF